MFHRTNTVNLVDRGKRFAVDPLEAFRGATKEIVPGIRTAADQLLRPVHDVDLSERVRNAILFGPRNKPVDAGDYAQVQTIGIERSLKEQEPHIFLPFDTEVPAGTRIQFYRPNRPEQLHRIIFAVPVNNIVDFSRQDAALVFDDGTQFFRLRTSGNPIEINFGKIGILLTPQNPLMVGASLLGDVNIDLQLSTAQLG